MAVVSRCFLLVLGLICVTPSAVGKVYKWIDQDGNMVFSDQPRSGAQEVNINVNPASAKQVAQNSNTPKQTVQTKKSKRPKTEIQLLSPQDGETVRSNTGTLYVTGKLSLPVGSTHKFVIYLDDRRVAESPTPQFQLTNVDRGEHQIQMKLVNSENAELALSKPHTVFLHRHSKNF